MAERSESSRDPNGVKVWTFLIRGGQAFRLGLTAKKGPLLDHDGKFTVWKMVGTAVEAVSIETMITGALIGARVERYTEEETAEMLELRRQGE